MAAEGESHTRSVRISLASGGKKRRHKQEVGGWRDVQCNVADVARATNIGAVRGHENIDALRRRPQSIPESGHTCKDSSKSQHIVFLFH